MLSSGLTSFLGYGMISLRVFSTITIFIMLGPPAGYLALCAIISHGDVFHRSKMFDQPMVYVFLFFSYIIGFIPALLCGLAVCISDRMIENRLLRIAAATFIGGSMGFLTLFSMDVLAHHGVSDMSLDLAAGAICAFAALCCACPLAFVASA